MSTTSETAIVTALRSGDVRRAVELILDVYQDDIFSYCVRLLGPTEALFAYHRVLSTAMEEIFSLSGQASIRAWLFRIARTCVLHFHRRQLQRFSGALEPDYVPSWGPNDAPGLRVADEALDACLVELDPATLEVLQLALWHGLGVAEVAYVVGRRESEARRMATRGLSLLDFEIARRSTAPS
jgi:DNA-directed RNA polymerase specialized sigma24 family protein